MLAMNLDHGGHLTHGSPVNFSGQLYRAVPYGVRKQDELIDMDEVRRLARLHRPKLIQCGTTAYSRTLDFAAFRITSYNVCYTKLLRAGACRRIREVGPAQA